MPSTVSRRPVPFSILERIDVGETAARPRTPSRHPTFSILERIDVGETSESRPVQHSQPGIAFSILERIDVGETRRREPCAPAMTPFSILERIDVGETTIARNCWSGSEGHLSVSSNGSTWVKHSGSIKRLPSTASSFSILERIDVGETTTRRLISVRLAAFSILERIDVGETLLSGQYNTAVGSDTFQYPRTDRRG